MNDFELEFEYAHSKIVSNPNSALDILIRMEKIQPTADIYHDIIYCYCEKGEYNSAEEYFYKYYKLEGKTGRLYHDYGYVLYCKKQYELALKCFSKSLKLFPESWRTLLNLSLCYISIDKVEMAEETVKKAYAINKSIDILITYCIILERQNKDVPIKLKKYLMKVLKK